MVIMNTCSEHIATLKKRPLVPLSENGAEFSTYDRSGILISFLCLIHCALTPFLLLLWPALHSHILESYVVHVIFALLVALSGGYAFWRGYKAHRTAHIMWMAVSGFVLLLCGIFSHEHEAAHTLTYGTILTILGSVLLISAHVKNLRTCRHRCECMNSPSSLC